MESSASNQTKSSGSRLSSVGSKDSKDNGNRTPFNTSYHRIVSYVSSKYEFNSNKVGETSKPPDNASCSKASIEKCKSPSNSSKIRVAKSEASTKRSACPCIQSLKGLRPKIHVSESSLPPGLLACDCNVGTDSYPQTKNKGKGPEFTSRSTSVQSFNLPYDKSLVSPSTLDRFEKHVNTVIEMTSHYQGEGLLCKTENFLRSCQEVKDKIQHFKEERKVKAKLAHLKEEVTNLETMTDGFKEELSGANVGSFLSCCKQFKNKLNHHHKKSEQKEPPQTNDVQKLVNQIDESILLSFEAKNKGLVSSDSVDEFIKNCNKIKAKVISEPRQLQKPQTINKLLSNIHNIIAFITKYKNAGSVSDSIENFYKTCINTRNNLTSYKNNSQKESKSNTCSSKGEQGTSASCCSKAVSKTISFEKSKAKRSSEKNTCCQSKTAANTCSKPRSPGSSQTKCVKCTMCSYQSSPSSSDPRLAPCTKSACTQCSHSCGSVRSGFIESVCNSCSEIGKSIISLLQGKNPLKQTVSIVIIKRQHDDHGNPIRISESNVKQFMVDQQRPVTLQKSDKSVKHVTSGPTKGVIGTVRSVKSTGDVPPSIIPIIWSHLSLQPSQQKYNNPFFCGSPQKKDSDSDIF